MIIYIKECTAMTVNTLIPWIKKNITLLPLRSLSAVNIDDIIVISNTDTSISVNDFLSYTVIVYENFFEKISLNVIQEHQYNYDYYHLENTLNQAMNPNISTIISGSSYGLYGIDSKLLSNEVNLSLPSQDLYYSLKGIYQVCKHNTNINNIVLCLGYYYFFSDLSKTQNKDEILRISNVYYPLYNDSHNCSLLPPKNEILYMSDIFDIQNVLNIYSLGEKEKGYFHNDHTRRNYATKEWDDKSKEWSHLNTDEKKEAGRRRTNLHNKGISRRVSLRENTMLFQDFLNFCDTRSINVLLVVTPSTTYYLNQLLSDYKTIFYDVLDKMEGTVHLLDLSDDESYTDEDFNDTDHLSDSGAYKLTLSIIKTLQEINNA